MPTKIRYFEFNEEMLLFIVNELNTNKYGTFLGNNVRERILLKVKTETQSMWTYVL